MIPTWDGGEPIKGADTPPTEPATPPSYGPNPTAQGVRGYRDLPPDDVALINAVKELQENVANVWAAIFVRPGTDPRWANISRTELEHGISSLVRSVARPHDPFAEALARYGIESDARARRAVADDLARTATSGPESSTKVFPDGPPPESTEDAR